MCQPGLWYQNQKDWLYGIQGTRTCFNACTYVCAIGKLRGDLLGTQVYNVALFVEAAPAKSGLHLSSRTPDAVCDALVNGPFRKVLQIHMLRDITIKQFQDGLKENLIPNLKKYGGSEHLDTFMNFFEDKSIVKGAEIPLLWSGEMTLSLTDNFTALPHGTTVFVWL